MFSLPVEIQAFQEKVRAFAGELMAPAAAEADRTAEYPAQAQRLVIARKLAAARE